VLPILKRIIPKLITNKIPINPIIDHPTIILISGASFQ
jgi:hypothetical protein